MGNLNNKNRNSISTNSNVITRIKIDKLDVRIENKPTQIDERSSSVLKYRTPHFKASARIKFPPINRDQIWKIGWIQACTYMQFRNSYGNLGCSSWEFPELATGLKPMISDSDGKNFPWYGSKTEVVLVKGPQQNFTMHHVSMNDNFYPHVTWDIPTSSDKTPKLTNIKRDQKFYTWLVAMDVLNGTFVVLKTFKWRMKLEIQVDPSKEQGSRAKLVSSPVPKQPYALKNNFKIPDCALYPSNANSAQILIWRPSLGTPVVVVSPKCYNKDEIIQNLIKNDAISLAKLLNLKNDKYRQIYFEDNSKEYLRDKFTNSPNKIYSWTEVISNYALARNSLSNQDYINSFELMSKSFKSLIELIKDARDENWQLPILFQMSVDLRLLAYTCDSCHRQDFESEQEKEANAEGSNQGQYAEKTAESLMVCFRNLCTDTRSESQVSKRWGMMHIINQLFKIYFKINKINLCNPLKRVIENSGMKDSFPIAHQIVYKFYVGRQAMFENDYNTAADYFEFAFRNCPSKYTRNKKIILVYLIPVNMLRGYMPNQDLLLKYDLKPFAEIVNAVKQGNIQKFNNDMIEYEDFFIESGVYLFLEKLKMTTYRNLFKKLAKLLNTAQIPIEDFVNVLKFLNEDDMDNDICQCILSNLIFEGKIKGYISHKHNKLVINKDFRAAFPRLTTINLNK